MATFHITASSYYGDEATRASGDRDGLRLFVNSLQTALGNGDAVFDSDGIRYRIERQSDAAELAAENGDFVFRLDSAKITEIVDLTEPLIASNTAGHQYVDITRPTSTLVISVDHGRRSAAGHGLQPWG
ncbi:hypothetical protein [Mycolicibacterium fortuitum]|uniref:hypothetical protein n=1 Tax=Mycolicibacterium fortuitum TaxID=1766 RepID=UPI00260B990C|nr:hypothetical protein [Mycolicibacterium fortuitum]